VTESIERGKYRRKVLQIFILRLALLNKPIFQLKSGLYFGFYLYRLGLDRNL
jgi:hypothetical protein